jgi:hypothetical protein
MRTSFPCNALSENRARSHRHGGPSPLAAGQRSPYESGWLRWSGRSATGVELGWIVLVTSGPVAGPFIITYPHILPTLWFHCF